MKDLDIRHFKLTNGEELVGLVSVNNPDNWIIERPVIVNTNLMGGYSFTPWFPFSDAKTFKILKSHIVQHVPVAEMVKGTYLQFALKMSEPQQIDPKTDRELLREYEEEVLDRYEYETSDEYVDKKKTIH